MSKLRRLHRRTSGPAEAIAKALACPSRIRTIPYDKKTDKDGAYAGWSFIKISVDEGVPLLALFVKKDDRLTFDYDGPGIFCESNECDLAECHRCFTRRNCKDHEKCEEFSRREDRMAKRP